DDLDLDYAHAIVVVEWGAGKLDGVSDEWLSIDIRRPEGGAARGALSDELGSDDLDGDEPRQVRIAGTGPRGLELEASLLTGE
ncbi:MAG: hypothetical protein ABUL47_03350, partial [Leifsonia sp.]